jgi:hypothetical protein
MKMRVRENNLNHNVEVRQYIIMQSKILICMLYMNNQVHFCLKHY